jgi:hypothetical protein
LTGDLNNLFVLDVDAKDDGLDEWSKFLEVHDEPNTLKVLTQSGGVHYHFKYKSDDEKVKALVASITNRSKVRGKGIDARTNGGYIVAPPSKTAKGEYKVANDTKIASVPYELLLWLLCKDANAHTTNGKHEKVKDQSSKQFHYNKKKQTYKYNISDDELVELLNKLPSEYRSNYSDWFIITTILKNLDKYEIWRSWSKKICKI